MAKRAASAARNRVAAASSLGAQVAGAASCSPQASPPPASRSSTSLMPNGRHGRPSPAPAERSILRTCSRKAARRASMTDGACIRLGLICSGYVPQPFKESSWGIARLAAARRSEPDHHLERLTLVHRTIAVRNLVKPDCPVEHEAGFDAAFHHVGKQLVDIG